MRRKLIKDGVVERRRDGTYAMALPRVNSDAIMHKVNRIVSALHVVPKAIEAAANVEALNGTSAIVAPLDPA